MSQTLNGRLPPEDSSDWPQTWPKRVSDDPRHFMFRLRDFYSGQHLGPKNVFQMIPDISFFDAENIQKKMQNFERPFTPRG